ncbi:MAG: N-acetylneuraminate synthase family protein [Betaproteobacteria bacterium]|nr:N-acetylneuraminate synthase family protein [Betaproteobacteria bacterium]
MSFKIGSRLIGDGQPCFVTFEAGPTHDGLQTAMKLVQAAADAGADAVKFQILDPERLVADKKQPFSYQILIDRKTGETKEKSEPLYDILKRRSLTKSEWKDLKSFSDSLDLAFFATVSFEAEVDFLAELGCDSIKIASGDVNHFPLIEYAARTGISLQLDTGNSTIGEIEAAIDVISRTGNDRIIIHHCPSGYPARREGINLRVIQTLKAMFPYPTAFSDHTPGWDMDIAAVCLGANMVEKTITLDRTTPSVEHIMSIEGKDISRFVVVIRDIEAAFGSPRRIMQEVEIRKRDLVRRSIFVKRDLRAGEILTIVDIDFRRPGLGIPPSEVDRILGRAIAVPKASGQMLRYEDLVAPTSSASSS